MRIRSLVLCMVLAAIQIGADRPTTHPASRPTARSAAAATRPAGVTVDLGDGMTMEFVPIPAGTFMMPLEDIKKPKEKRFRKVTITKPFYLGKYEVTQEQWQALMGTNPSKDVGPKNPVEQVSWDECQTFAKKLAEKSPDKVFRLPTEAEWEYASRAGSKTRFFFGDSDAKLVDYAWIRKNSEDRHHPIGQKKPNPWGLYDIYGNVFEWCSDWFVEAPQLPEQDVQDPIGPETGKFRCMRGGSFNENEFWNRSSSRFANSPTVRFVTKGVRIAFEPK